MPLNRATATKTEQWESQLDFPQAFVWESGVFCVLHEDGSVEFGDAEGPFILSYDALRHIWSMAGQFREARRRKAEQ